MLNQFLKKYFRVTLALIVLSPALAFGLTTTRKLHPSIQKLYDATTFNDSNEATSSTLSLNGGDYGRVSFFVHISSSTGDSTATLTVEVSPDGGTTWGSTGDTITLSTGTASAFTTQVDDINVAPGLDLRITNSLTGSTTYYNMTLWAMPTVD